MTEQKKLIDTLTAAESWLEELLQLYSLVVRGDLDLAENRLRRFATAKRYDELNAFMFGLDDLLLEDFNNRKG